MKHCSKCTVEYADDIVFCPHCGDKLIDGNLQYTCPNCGQLLGSSFEKFCPHCGQQFMAHTNDTSSQSSTKTKSSNHTIIIAISVIVILVGGYFVFKQNLINAGIVSPSTAEEYYNYSNYLSATDSLKSASMHKLAAINGHPEAQYEEGIKCYENPFLGRLAIDGYNKISSEGYSWFLKASEQGHVMAQYQLGNIYEYGSIGFVDTNEAYRYYKLAADGNNPNAYFKLGIAYKNGITVEKDTVQAFKMYNKAYELGNNKAGYVVALRYWRGDGVEKNKQKSLGMLEELDKKNFGPAQRKLGIIYKYGFDVQKDVGKAIDYFNKAIKNHDIESYAYLGDIFWHDGIHCDYNKAFRYYSEGADHNDKKSMIGLRNLYLVGNGVERDLDMARFWHEKAQVTADPKNYNNY